MSYSTECQSNIAKADLFNLAVTANTNFLASDVSATIQPASVWFIYVSTLAAASLKVIRTQISTNAAVTEIFPISTLMQPAWYNILVGFGETINFQLDTSTTLLRFNASEIVPMTFHQGA